MEIMYARKLENRYFANKNIIGFVGEDSDLNSLVNNIEYYKINSNKKIKSVIGKNNDYTKALGLDGAILNRKISELSGTDYKLIMLIKAVMLKPEIIILNNFEIGLNDRINNRIIRFIKTINGAFNIKFIVISQNAIYLNKLCKSVIVMKNGIIKCQGDISEAIKQNFLAAPPIIEFIEKANNKKAKLDETFDEKELLKAIYRSVS